MVRLRCSKPLNIQTKDPFMSIVSTLSLKSNRQMKFIHKRRKKGKVQDMSVDNFSDFMKKVEKGDLKR